jgi:hypothetical protein
MLALNSPVIQQGFFYASNGSVHGEFRAACAIEGGAVIGPDSLIRTIREIEDLNADESRSGDGPSVVAQESAKRLLCEAQLDRPLYLIPSVVEASEGDLLIHWDTAVKSVVLICPASAGKPAQIYREVLDGKRAVHSEIMDASPRALSDALAWVLRPR